MLVEEAAQDTEMVCRAAMCIGCAGVPQQPKFVAVDDRSMWHRARWTRQRLASCEGCAPDATFPMDSTFRAEQFCGAEHAGPYCSPKWLGWVDTAG